MNNRPPNCQAHCDRGTSTIICTRCGIQWEADDDDPPDCVPVNGKAVGRTAIKQMKESLRS